MTATLRRPASLDLQTLDTLSLSLSYRMVAARVLPWAWVLALGMGGWILLAFPDRLLPFLATVPPALLICQTWQKQPDPVLPVLPLFVLVQMVVYGLPLINTTIQADWRVSITPELLASCALPLALWFLALWLGWMVVPRRWAQMRRGGVFSFVSRGVGRLPHILLAISLGLIFILSLPEYWTVLGSFGRSLLSPLRTASNLAAVVGCFLGSYEWARQKLQAKWLWLALVVALVFGAFSTLLLSAAQAPMLALMLGVWLGRSRQALAITLALLLLLGFLHQGKFILREKYWVGGNITMPQDPIALVQEWVEASLTPRPSNSKADDQGLFSGRLNNLQNLLYIEQALDRGTPTMDGKSLEVIPETLVPRFLDQDKVRSQQGQVLLNLHFGRQRSLKDTQTAYIAWGLLPEGIGNFGSVMGPLILGIATGALVRCTENLSRGQLLLTTPGLLGVLLLVLWLSSFEMVASTFLAAAMQLILLVLFISWVFPGRARA